MTSITLLSDVLFLLFVTLNKKQKYGSFTNAVLLVHCFRRRLTQFRTSESRLPLTYTNHV